MTSIEAYLEINREETFSIQDLEVSYPDSAGFLFHSGKDKTIDEDSINLGD